MKPEGGRGIFLRFVLCFGLIFAVLIVPWPGWNAVYGSYFRWFAQAAFGSVDTRQIVRFAPATASSLPANLDTRVTLANRDLLDSSGKGLMVRTEFDSRSIGWVPTALTVSLILATPVPWRRRGLALLGGLGLIHAFILFSLQTWIWDNLATVSLAQLSPAWKVVADDLEYTLITQLGASFSIPVVIWTIVTFRRQDIKMLETLIRAGRDNRKARPPTATVPDLPVKKRSSSVEPASDPSRRQR